MTRKILPCLAICIFSLQQMNAQNNAITFNGSTSYVSTPTSILGDGVTNFTIEFWVKPSASNFDGNYHGVLGGQHPTTSKRNPSIWIYTNGVVHLDSYQYTTDVRYLYEGYNNFFVANEWTHLAWVKSGTSNAVYRNGQLVITYTSVSQLNVPGSYNFGKIDNFFSGSLDEIRFWSVARTGDQIRANMFNKSLANNSAGLLAYYKCNEGAGTTLANSCTNTSGIDGTLTNTPTWVSSPIQFGSNSLNLDGTSDYMSLPAAVYFNDNTFTIEAWVYVRSHANYARILDFGNGSGNNNIVFTLSAGTDGKPGLTLVNGSGTSEYIGSSTALTLNTWTHVAAVLNGTTGKIYINGVEKGSGTFTLTPANVTRTLNYIGKSNWAGNDYANAQFDEIRLWNTARTQLQIQSNIYKELDPATESDLLAYYTFNQGIASGTNSGLLTVEDLKGNYPATLVGFNLSGASSNFATQFSSLFGLPISWQSFMVTRNAEEVLLKWTVSDQFQCKNYEVQYSTDGKQWNTLSIIDATPNNAGNTNYEYKAWLPANNTCYFRIKQNDWDGKASYSITRTLKASGLSSIKIPGMAPGGRFSIESTQAAVIRLVGMDGKERLTATIKPGWQSMDWSFLESGVYIIKTPDESKRIVITH